MSHQGQEAIADDSQRLMSFNGRPQPLSRLKLDGFGEKNIRCQPIHFESLNQWYSSWYSKKNS
jgi:hypothetical protein